MADRPEGVAVYVHWPYCARICPYCDFNVVRDRGQAEQADLVEAILADLTVQAAELGPRPLASVFFGGGTPSLMPPAAVERVLERARALFPPTGFVETALEANPADCAPDRLKALAEAGVERLSLGLQSLDDGALRFLGRDHTADQGRRALAAAQAVFSRVSIDLIYARPGQTLAAWSAELDAALTLGAGHLSPYQLTIEQRTAFGRAFERGRLVPPDEDTTADLYEATQTILSARGFDAYEVSNHARSAEDRSIHNLHVWRGGDYLGLGPGAHGRLTHEGARRATVAHRRVGDYVAGVARGRPWAETTAMDDRAAAEERLLLALRTTEGAPLSLLEPLGLSTDARPLADLIEEGFLETVGDRLAASRAGRPLLDSILKRLLT